MNDSRVSVSWRIVSVSPGAPKRHSIRARSPGTRMLWELEDDPAGTVLRLSHFVLDPALAIENCYAVGLHTSLDRLGPCLAGTPAPWDWDGFARNQERYAAAGLAPALPD